MACELPFSRDVGDDEWSGDLRPLLRDKWLRTSSFSCKYLLRDVNSDS